MLAFLARRLLLAVFTVWAISVLAWVIIQLPEGDLVDKYFEALQQGGEAGGGDDQIRIAAMRLYLSLDQPMMVRYGKWMWNLAHGDLGRSFSGTLTGTASGARARDQPVKRLIGDRLWLTVVLTGFTIVVTWTFAIPVGIYSAVRQHSIGDYAFTLLGFTGLAVPDFLLGLVLMYVAFAYFDQSVGGLLSADYMNAPWNASKFLDLMNHLWIPAVVLGTSGTASLIRIMRNNLLDELAKPYVVTARAKGVSSFRLIVKYPVRVAVNPLISTVGYLLPALISGSVIVSVVLSLPTMGPLLLAGIQDQDSYLAGFIVLMLGVLTVLGTLISDILLVVVDPRIRYTDR
jgi:peptide/nickel transport system permease protein